MVPAWASCAGRSVSAETAGQLDRPRIRPARARSSARAAAHRAGRGFARGGRRSWDAHRKTPLVQFRFEKLSIPLGRKKDDRINAVEARRERGKHAVAPSAPFLLREQRLAQPNGNISLANHLRESGDRARTPLDSHIGVPARLVQLLRNDASPERRRQLNGCPGSGGLDRDQFIAHGKALGVLAGRRGVSRREAPDGQDDAGGGRRPDAGAFKKTGLPRAREKKR